MQTTAATTSSHPKWAILDRIPVVPDENPPPHDAALLFSDPPQVSVLSLTRRISPDPTTPHNFPKIVAATSGLVLFSATQGPAPGPLCAFKPNGAFMFSWRHRLPGYFLCDLSHPDPTSQSPIHLPDPDFPINSFAHIGLITHTDNNDYSKHVSTLKDQAQF